MVLDVITDLLASASQLLASGQVSTDKINNVCAQAPPGVAVHVDTMIGWVKYGVAAVIFAVGFASVGAMLVGKFGSMGRAAQVGTSGLVFSVLAAVAYVVIYGVINFVVGGAC